MLSAVKRTSSPRYGNIDNGMNYGTYWWPPRHEPRFSRSRGVDNGERKTKSGTTPPTETGIGTTVVASIFFLKSQKIIRRNVSAPTPMPRPNNSNVETDIPNLFGGELSVADKI